MTESTNLLLIDAGNTRIKADALTGGRLTRAFSVETQAFEERLPDAIEAVDFGPGAVVMSSVVRGVDTAAGPPVAKKWGLELVVVNPGMPLGIDVDVPRPETVGIDRLLMAGEAYTRYKKAVIVVGAGTAITVDVVTEDGVYVGGSISAGLRTSSWALASRTSLLPEVQFNEDVEGIPKTTTDAIRTGIRLGAAGSIDRLVEVFASRAKLGSFTVVLTGGDSGLIGPDLTTPHEIVDDLLMWGLAHTYGRIVTA